MNQQQGLLPLLCWGFGVRCSPNQCSPPNALRKMLSKKCSLKLLKLCSGYTYRRLRRHINFFWGAFFSGIILTGSIFFWAAFCFGEHFLESILQGAFFRGASGSTPCWALDHDSYEKPDSLCNNSILLSSQRKLSK